MTISWMRDTIERTLRTYVQGLLGFLVASWSGAIDLPTLQAAAWAAVPAAIAIIMSALATQTDGTVSPASFAKASE
jgi:hypothetical protein